MSRSVDFDKDIILEKAMNVFWTQGYENTSLRDLMEATGLLKGSLYNTFKSKENLFLLCLEKYGAYSGSFHYKTGDPKEYLLFFFNKLVKEGSDKKFTKGCMIMNSCLEFAGGNKVLSKKSKALFENTENNLSNVVDTIFADEPNSQVAKELKVKLITAAFSIREISKFRKDEIFLKQIANDALRDLDISV